MKNLDDRINNVIATKKDFKVIDISKYGVQAPNNGTAVKVPVEYTITSNTTIMGNFILKQPTSGAGKNVAISLTKNNFSVESTVLRNGNTYGAILYRSNNQIYLKSSQLRSPVQINSGSYLLFTDSL